MGCCTSSTSVVIGEPDKGEHGSLKSEDVAAMGTFTTRESDDHNFLDKARPSDRETAETVKGKGKGKAKKGPPPPPKPCDTSDSKRDLLSGTQPCTRVPVEYEAQKRNEVEDWRSKRPCSGGDITLPLPSSELSNTENIPGSSGLGGVMLLGFGSSEAACLKAGAPCVPILFADTMAEVVGAPVAFSRLIRHDADKDEFSALEEALGRVAKHQKWRTGKNILVQSFVPGNTLDVTQPDPPHKHLLKELGLIGALDSVIHNNDRVPSPVFQKSGNFTNLVMTASGVTGIDNIVGGGIHGAVIHESNMQPYLGRLEKLVSAVAGYQEDDTVGILKQGLRDEWHRAGCIRCQLLAGGQNEADLPSKVQCTGKYLTDEVLEPFVQGLREGLRRTAAAYRDGSLKQLLEERQRQLGEDGTRASPSSQEVMGFLLRVAEEVEQHFTSNDVSSQSIRNCGFGCCA
eukprot:TRINITY_DN25824_c0_g1_i2.p1 TRINITY_DN25824_c0_g1~~TRINITY_DN25824_c0_g1_i2.p1  ORF type:complete len:458 (+),score=60.22 TRINITY_DN25824_c0_g1_i2:62-1435(+)